MTNAPSWQDSELEETAIENRGLGSDVGLSEEIRFRAGAVRLLRNRLNERGSAESEYAPAVLFLLPDVPESIHSDEMSWGPMLDNGLTAIEGGLWFVGPAVVGGYGVVIADWEDATVFRMASTDSAMGGAPAVWLETRTKEPRARFY